MTCEELKEMYELYAMGVSDEPERGEIASHLAEGCAACTIGVKHAVELVSMYGAMTPVVEPPARLRARIVASAGGVQQSNWFWSWSPLWGGAAASLGRLRERRGYERPSPAHRERCPYARGPAGDDGIPARGGRLEAGAPLRRPQRN